MSLIGVFLFVLFVGWLLMVASVVDLQEFLRRFTLIEMSGVSAFKDLVRRQMYMSLALTLLFWGAAMLGIAALALEDLGNTQVVLFIALFVMIEGTWLFKRKLREQVRNIPAEDKGTDSLLQALCLEWNRRTLPSF
jgi:hypothetical protein